MKPIASGLAAIEAEIDAGAFVFDINDEDIHMAIESELTRRIGEAGKRLHTGRSRNDQVATDTRLAAKALSKQLMEANLKLRQVLVRVAIDNGTVVLPGMTHLQHAQPVLLSHHLLAYYWMFTRDFKRLDAAFEAADASPLGAAALAGTTYPLDRVATAYAMGFTRVIPNSLDAVSDRDFLLDLHFACSTMAMHLSRLAEEIVLWSSSEFGYITLSDSFSTGSSIMPQKKNPDFAELIRGKTGRVYGNLMQLLVTCKGLPLAYNKDLQEDKEGALDSARTLSQCLEVMAAWWTRCTSTPSACAPPAGSVIWQPRMLPIISPRRACPFVKPMPSWGIWCWSATTADASWRICRSRSSKRRARCSRPTLPRHSISMRLSPRAPRRAGRRLPR